MCPIITINPDICHGKPCIRGLRCPVKSVLEWLASGMTVDDILSDCEDLNREDILAVLSYATWPCNISKGKAPLARASKITNSTAVLSAA